MKTKKLSLNDFEVMGVEDLLKVKGGYRPSVNHSRAAILQEGGGGSGGGSTNGCPQCKQANGVNGTPIPDRCNGSAHSSFSSAWDAFTDFIGGALGMANPVRAAGSAGAYTGNVAAQMDVQGYFNSSTYSDASP